MTNSHMNGAELARVHATRFRVVSYRELRSKATDVAGQLLQRYGNDKRGVVISPVLMGGGLPARLIVDALLGHDMVAAVVACQIRRYDGIEQGGEATISLSLPKAKVKGQIVVGVDDLVDGGQTLAAFREHALAQGAAVVDTAVIFAKPHSTEKPGFCAEAGVTQWLVMPGEELDFMDQIVTADEQVAALPRGEQEAYFCALGFDAECVKGWRRLKFGRLGVQ